MQIYCDDQTQVMIKNTQALTEMISKDGWRAVFYESNCFDFIKTYYAVNVCLLWISKVIANSPAFQEAQFRLKKKLKF